MRNWLSRHVLKRVLVLGLTALLALAIVLPASPALAWTTPPAPTLVNVNPYGNEGDYLIGAIPPGASPSKPVLVFVQGLHGSAQNWWGPTMYYGNNDMYAYAYNNGYRTAFVQFRDADGSAGSMWLNGSVLRQQLQSICQYYGVSKVNVVGHSKGGIDTQSAIVHYGAYPYVQNVFTLSSPHRGSELADLCYSWWSWWLAALLGQRDDGTYVMQTSYMNYFRSLTDGRPENSTIRYYTGAGTDWGDWFTAIWFGGNYLWFYDDNDGAVCVYSAHGLPGATNVFTAGLNHDNIRMGSRSWNYIAPYISYYRTSGLDSPMLLAECYKAPPAPVLLAMTGGALPVSGAAVASAPPAKTGLAEGKTLNTLVRGGEISGTAAETFQVESGVSALNVTCLVGNSGATLLGPNGETVALAGQAGALPDDVGVTGSVDASAAQEFFAGATVLGATVDSPAAGEWTLTFDSSSATDAYLALVHFAGGATLDLATAPKPLYQPGEKVNLAIGALGADLAPLTGVTVTGVAVETAPAKGSLGASPDYGVAARFKLAPVPGAENLYEGGFRLPGREGVYSLTIDLAGTQTDGTIVNRTLVLSILVLKPAHQNVDGLRELTE